MSELQVRHIASMLKKNYSDKIDVSDCLTTKIEDKEAFLLTRAYAAYSLQVIAGASEDAAANSITDGANDNGIDAVLFDRITKILWIVQSKWKRKGTGEPESGDTLKFCSGIRKIIENDFDSFNNKIKMKQDDIEDALNDYTVKIHLILAYTGDDKLSTHNSDAINRLLKDINEDSEELISFETFTLSKAHKALAGLSEGQPINSEITVEHFEKIDTPYKMIYGIVNGSVFAQLWDKYRNKLFNENIRGFLGDSVVNEDMQNTISQYPENFLYYNNGITLLCDSFVKKPLVQQNAGTFDAKNLKVVNGAQTVGTIGKAYSQSPDSVEKIWVSVKLISLENCPQEFGENVTKKTNTQNRIEKRDFVSLDPLQDKLKTELAILGVDYHIKRYAGMNVNDTSCTVEDAIVAVGCSLSNIDITVTAKREVGLLWNDINQEPYTLIINEKLTAIKVWRCVQIMRKLNNYIKVNSKNKKGKEKQCLIHSNRFVLHILLNKNASLLDDESIDFDSYLESGVQQDIETIEKQIVSAIEKKYKTSLVHQVFRNYTKCRALQSLLLK